MTATKPDGARFGRWHCASRDQADWVVDKWLGGSLNLTFRIDEMLDWLYIITLDHRPAGTIGRLLKEDHPEGALWYG